MGPYISSDDLESGRKPDDNKLPSVLPSVAPNMGRRVITTKKRPKGLASGDRDSPIDIEDLAEDPRIRSLFRSTNNQTSEKPNKNPSKNYLPTMFSAAVEKLNMTDRPPSPVAFGTGNRATAQAPRPFRLSHPKGLTKPTGYVKIRRRLQLAVANKQGLNDADKSKHLWLDCRLDGSPDDSTRPDSIRCVEMIPNPVFAHMLEQRAGDPDVHLLFKQVEANGVDSSDWKIRVLHPGDAKSQVGSMASFFLHNVLNRNKADKRKYDNSRVRYLIHGKAFGDDTPVMSMAMHLGTMHYFTKDGFYVEYGKFTNGPMGKQMTGPGAVCGPFPYYCNGEYLRGLHDSAFDQLEIAEMIRRIIRAADRDCDPIIKGPDGMPVHSRKASEANNTTYLHHPIGPRLSPANSIYQPHFEFAMKYYGKEKIKYCAKGQQPTDTFAANFSFTNTGEYHHDWESTCDAPWPHNIYVEYAVQRFARQEEEHKQSPFYDSKDDIPDESMDKNNPQSIYYALKKDDVFHFDEDVEEPSEMRQDSPPMIETNIGYQRPPIGYYYNPNYGQEYVDQTYPNYSFDVTLYREDMKTWPKTEEYCISIYGFPPCFFYDADQMLVPIFLTMGLRPQYSGYSSPGLHGDSITGFVLPDRNWRYRTQQDAENVVLRSDDHEDQKPSAVPLPCSVKSTPDDATEPAANLSTSMDSMTISDESAQQQTQSSSSATDWEAMYEAELSGKASSRKHSALETEKMSPDSPPDNMMVHTSPRDISDSNLDSLCDPEKMWDSSSPQLLNHGRETTNHASYAEAMDSMNVNDFYVQAPFKSPEEPRMSSLGSMSQNESDLLVGDPKDMTNASLMEGYGGKAAILSKMQEEDDDTQSNEEAEAEKIDEAISAWLDDDIPDEPLETDSPTPPPLADPSNDHEHMRNSLDALEAAPEREASHYFMQPEEEEKDLFYSDSDDESEDEEPAAVPPRFPSKSVSGFAYVPPPKDTSDDETMQSNEDDDKSEEAAPEELDAPTDAATAGTDQSTLKRDREFDYESDSEMEKLIKAKRQRLSDMKYPFARCVQCPYNMRAMFDAHYFCIPKECFVTDKYGKDNKDEINYPPEDMCPYTKCISCMYNREAIKEAHEECEPLCCAVTKMYEAEDAAAAASKQKADNKDDGPYDPLEKS